MSRNTYSYNTQLPTVAWIGLADIMRLRMWFWGPELMRIRGRLFKFLYDIIIILYIY